MIELNIQDTFTKELPADPNRNNTRRQVEHAAFSYVTPRVTDHAQVLHVSPEMLKNIGLKPDDAQSESFKNLVTGGMVYLDTAPYAMCYGGHQFGHWAGQLGDGRAINLFEVKNGDDRWALQLKGAGETPYSRTADGNAVLRSSIREHLCSESMHHLGVPTTRSLSLSLTGEKVLRDMLYNGNAAYEKGAVVCRVSPSFIRFGNFQIFTSRKDIDSLRKLTDYTIEHYFPHLEKNKDGYIAFFKEVSRRTLEMILHWQRVGFVHGVMNTDNMSILGLTIDYGPYGWLEDYDPNWTPNTTDSRNRRYRYGNQPSIGLWNLNQLANALFPLIEEVEPLEEILKDYQSNYMPMYISMMNQKLGLVEKNINEKCIASLEENLVLTETDYTIFFRELSKISKQNTASESLQMVNNAFYRPEEIAAEIRASWTEWFEMYIDIIKKENLESEERSSSMNAVNPKYVLRNYMAQIAIDNAEEGDYGTIDELYTMLKNPYEDQPKYEKYYAKRPEYARNKVGCSMLSCSS